MKTSMFAAAALAVLAAPVFAGGPTVVAEEPAPVAAAAPVPAHDWSGPYVGLGYGSTSADVLFTPGVGYDFNDGTMGSLYAGYLFQQGAFVYGGEVSYGSINDSYVPGGFGDDDEIDSTLDLKARLGYAMDRFLVYGVLGYSMSNYVEPPSPEWDTDGFAYGIGADYAVSQSLSVGLEYMNRDLSGDNPNGLGQTADINLDSLSLRVGLSF